MDSRRAEPSLADDPFGAFRQALVTYSPIPDGDWQVFSTKLRLGSCVRGQIVVPLGERKICTVFVLKGLMRAYYIGLNGEEYVNSFAAEGEMTTAYGAALRHEPANLIVEAIEDTKYIAIDFGEWEKMSAHSLTWQVIARGIAERFYSVREQHTHQLLTMTGQQKYEAFRALFPHLVGRVPQKHIAGYLGMTPSSLNRLIAQVQRSKRAGA